MAAVKRKQTKPLSCYCCCCLVQLDIRGDHFKKLPRTGHWARARWAQRDEVKLYCGLCKVVYIRMHKFVFSACASTIKWNHDAICVHIADSAAPLAYACKHGRTKCKEKEGMKRERLEKWKKKKKTLAADDEPHTRRDLIRIHFNFMKVFASATSTLLRWLFPSNAGAGRWICRMAAAGVEEGRQNFEESKEKSTQSQSKWVVTNTSTHTHTRSRAHPV